MKPASFSNITISLILLATSSVWADDRPGNFSHHNRDNTDRFIHDRYSGCRILDRDRDDGRLEIKINHRGVEKVLLFNPTHQWERTIWEIRREQLPKQIVRALSDIGFSFRNLDDNDNMIVDTPMGRFYAVQVDTDRRDGIYVISENGMIVHRYTDDSWNDGRLRGDNWKRDWRDRWEKNKQKYKGNDGEDRFDEGDDEWDDRHKARRKRYDDDRDGEDRFDEGDDEWDDRHKARRKR